MAGSPIQEMQIRAPRFRQQIVWALTVQPLPGPEPARSTVEIWFSSRDHPGRICRLVGSKVADLLGGAMERWRAHLESVPFLRHWSRAYAATFAGSVWDSGDGGRRDRIHERNRQLGIRTGPGAAARSGRGACHWGLLGKHRTRVLPFFAGICRVAARRRFLRRASGCAGPSGSGPRLRIRVDRGGAEGTSPTKDGFPGYREA